MSPPDRKAVTVSREDLFRQVWSTPMSRLAKDYGISGNGLAKICDRLKVPYPPRGYWAKKAAGKKVAQYRLPDLGKGIATAVTIAPTPPPQKIPPEVQQQVEAAKKETGAIPVPARLLRPHPIVAKWLTEREQQRAEARRERDPWRSSWAPADWTATEHRQHRILDALFKAAEQRGVPVKQDERFTVYFEPAGERVNFKLREKHKQVKTPKTPEEMKRLLPGDKSWRQELQPTGVLWFSIETYVPALSLKTWTDTDSQHLEEKVGEIIVALLTAGPLLVKQRLEREEAERLRRQAELQRQKEAERKRLDDNRWRRFTEIAERSRRADDARRLLAALEQQPDAGERLADGSSLNDWLAWARNRLDTFDPITTGARHVFDDVLKITNWTYKD